MAGETSMCISVAVVGVPFYGTGGILLRFPVSNPAAPLMGSHNETTIETLKPIYGESP